VGVCSSNNNSNNNYNDSNSNRMSSNSNIHHSNIFIFKGSHQRGSVRLTSVRFGPSHIVFKPSLTSAFGYAYYYYCWQLLAGARPHKTLSDDPKCRHCCCCCCCGFCCCCCCCCTCSIHEQKNGDVCVCLTSNVPLSSVSCAHAPSTSSSSFPSPSASSSPLFF